MIPASRLPLFASISLALLAPRPAAGGSGENVVLIVDPSSPESMYVANYYKSKRNVPDANVLYIDPGAASYVQFAATNVPALLGTIAGRGIQDHVDFVVIPPGGSFYLPAPGLVSDGCFAVSRFAIASGYTLAFIDDLILSGSLSSAYDNEYQQGGYEPHYFDSNLHWRDGQPDATGTHYFIGALLGYTGERGNTLAEVLDMIDRSVLVDGTHPAGTFYFMETTDSARSGPRDNHFPAAVAEIVAAGGAAEHLFAVLPTGRHDALGVMTGWATPDIDGADMTLLPGAFCDHLTSFAGRFDTSSQTKMSRWIAKGASGTAGTVEEPCNYPGKFPHARMHVEYFDGLTLGEAWFRSVGFAPFQNLLLGDPLTRPFAHIPVVDLGGLPGGGASGTIALLPSAGATAPGATIAYIELHIDGVLTQTVALGDTFALDTTSFADGWHDLRVLAFDDTPVRNVGVFRSPIEFDNDGHSVTLGVGPTSGDLAQRFDFSVAAAGGVVEEVRLLHNGRVVASTSSASDTLSVFGQNLGAGPVSVLAEALFATGAAARSAPLALTVDYSGTPASMAPAAFGYTRPVRTDAAAVLELPAAFDDDPGSASYTLVQAPAQSTVLASGGPYVVIRPDATARGADTLVFRVDTPGGASNEATIELEYTCWADTFCVTSPNSVGPGALISHSGSPSLSAADFGLVAQGCPPRQFGIFYYGPNRIQIPFGEGFRCVGGQVFRLPLSMTDLFGFISQPLDFAAHAARIKPSTTWNFQFWYRDPAGGGTAFNLSDGLSVSFCP